MRRSDDKVITAVSSKWDWMELLCRFIFRLMNFPLCDILRLLDTWLLLLFGCCHVKKFAHDSLDSSLSTLQLWGPSDENPAVNQSCIYVLKHSITFAKMDISSCYSDIFQACLHFACCFIIEKSKFYFILDDERKRWLEKRENCWLERSVCWMGPVQHTRPQHGWYLILLCYFNVG